MEPSINNNDDQIFSEKITKKEKLKLKAQKDKSGVWFGLGMMGMIGWSVAVPSLLGAAFGIWLDNKYAQSFSWTLTFLLGGMIAGAIIAWYWVSKEDKEMHKKSEDDDN